MIREDGINWLHVVFVASFSVYLGHRACGGRALVIAVQLFQLMVQWETWNTAGSPGDQTNHSLTQRCFDLRYIGNVISNFIMKC